MYFLTPNLLEFGFYQTVWLDIAETCTRVCSCVLRCITICSAKPFGLHLFFVFLLWTSFSEGYFKFWYIFGFLGIIHLVRTQNYCLRAKWMVPCDLQSISYLEFLLNVAATCIIAIFKLTLLDESTRIVTISRGRECFIFGVEFSTLDFDLRLIITMKGSSLLFKFPNIKSIQKLVCPILFFPYLD